MTYSEAQVRDIIDENLYMKEKVASLERQLGEEKRKYEYLETEYNSLTKRCIILYIETSGDIPRDEIEVKVFVPQFLSQADLRVALTQTITDMVLAERSKLALGRQL